MKPGDKVHVEFDGVIRELNAYDECARINECSPEGWAHYIYLEGSYTKVTVVAEPSDWEKYGPPQVGDIWDDNGAEFIAEGDTEEPNGVLLTEIDDAYTHAGNVEAFGKLNPRLIRRRGMGEVR